VQRSSAVEVALIRVDAYDRASQPTFAPLCQEKVSSSLKSCARWSSCSSLRAPASLLTERSLPFSTAGRWVHPGHKSTPEAGACIVPLTPRATLMLIILHGWIGRTVREALERLMWGWFPTR
jgi:hypothetical protein